MPVKNLQGQTFNRLRVLHRVENAPSRHAVWVCECSCGTIKPVSSTGLIWGHAQSCGCLQKEYAGYASRIRPFESTFNRVREIARKKKFDFNLTYEEFLIFTRTTVCHYCLTVVPWMPHGHGQQGRTRYNLDRKDSSKGYSFLNCVVCCKRCNRGKSDLFTYEEWWKMTEYLRRENDNQQIGISNVIGANRADYGGNPERKAGESGAVETADAGREIESSPVVNEVSQ